MNSKRLTCRLLMGAVLAMAFASASQAQNVLEVITVTAQKKEESINVVPMSISAISGVTLDARHIIDVADLAAVVPGFSKDEGNLFGNANFSLRGIGTQSASFIGTQAVTIYMDQAPLAYSIMAQGLTYDLERVEVLKGPQGTLFGQNSTGGAINFIPAKPGDEYEAEVDLTYGRFNTINAEGFVNIPVSDSFGVRIAGQINTADGWQRSVTRPGDELAKTDSFAGRIIADWKPSDRTRFTLNASYFGDDSESPTFQFREFIPGNPGNAPLVAGQFAGQTAAFQAAGLNNARNVDFPADFDLEKDIDQYQIVLQAEYDLTESTTFYSLSNYVNHDSIIPNHPTGTGFFHFAGTTPLEIESFSQELRFAGTWGDRVEWMLGGSYQSDDSFVDLTIAGRNTTAIGPIFTPTSFWLNIFAGLPPEVLGLFDARSPDPNTPNTHAPNRQDVETFAVFGKFNYDLTDTLTFQSSARWTDYENDFDGCLADPGNGLLATFTEGFPNFPTNQPGECATQIDPGSPPIPGMGLTGFVPATSGSFVTSLEQDNISWRVGLDWKPTDRLLLYGNVARGYKAGLFPETAAITAEQYAPVTQESLTAYEVGIKQTFDTLQLNGAFFYYDYVDKQTAGTTDTILGALPAVVSVPEAEVIGVELDGIWRPTENLTASFGVSYLDTEVNSSQVKSSSGGGLRPAIDPLTNVIDLDGLALPNTSKWNFSADFEYRQPFGNSSEYFVGVSPQHRSSYVSVLATDPRFRIDGYTLLDVRAGATFDNERWGVMVWGRNVTDQFYQTMITFTNDALGYYNGRPATYGVTISYNF